MLKSPFAVGLVAAAGFLLTLDIAQARPAAKHNVILFVADGLRSESVNPEVAPALAALRRAGVDFRNSHSLYPTVTTVNASAIATGHGIGDTGDFGNTLYTASPFASQKGAMVVPMENDAVLGEMNAHFGGDYLGATSLLEAAQSAGFSTAVIGKLGPAAIQAVTAREGRGTIVIDDGAGHAADIAVAPDVVAAIAAAGLPQATPGRGANGKSGTLVPNTAQQDWFVQVATKVLLPRFKAARRPFVLVFWSRDPDGTQHNQGDSPGALTPGINGPTSRAAIRNADNDLAALRAALKSLGLEATTDVVVTADHGFSTVAKDSRTSPAAQATYPDVPKGQLPPGFVGIDLARALKLPLYDAAGLAAVDWTQGAHPRSGGTFIGEDPAHPQVVVAANGGSDLIYLPNGDSDLARRVVSALLPQDYVGAVFVDDRFGPIPGTLPTSAVGLAGDARTPKPAIIVSFRSYDTGCGELCAADIADADYVVGQGIHGSLSRADTHNFMAAIGPDFKAGFRDPAPVSNADLAPTLARLLRLDLSTAGQLKGRVAAEAIRGGAVARVSSQTLRSPPTESGLVESLRVQIVGAHRYFDAAGYPGRTVGLEAVRP